MEATYSNYNFEKSIDRITEILNSSDALYEDKKFIPSRDTLTFNNGYYIDCSALFIDMRGSKALSEKHRRPTLAKIYKTYISELVAVLRNHLKVHEIYIEGDCVWGIYETPNKSDIDDLFTIAGTASTLIEILNIKYKRKGYSEISVGIGLSYGSSLYIKSGHKGSGVNEIVWLGKTVSEAAKLCSYGNKTSFDYETMVSVDFYNNLNEHHKQLLSYNASRECYHGYIVRTDMHEWVKNNS